MPLLGIVGTPFILLQAGLDQATDYWSWGSHDITDKLIRRVRAYQTQGRAVWNAMKQCSVQEDQSIRTLSDREVRQSQSPPSCALSPS